MYGVSARNGKWNSIAEKVMFNCGGVTVLPFFFFFLIYLAALRLCCGTWDL